LKVKLHLSSPTCSTTYDLDEILYPFIRAALALPDFVHNYSRFLPKKKAPFRGAKMLTSETLGRLWLRKRVKNTKNFKTVYYHLVQLRSC